MKGGPFSEKTVSAIKRGFREYYFKQSNAIEEPSKIEQREFGYMQFGQSGMTRHLSFKTMKELNALLVRETPSDVYCSNAYYQFPTQQPMQEKHWLGADLIFDIDGKDLNLPCVLSHSYVLCLSCGYALPFMPEEQKSYSCASCGSNKIDQLSIPCSKCIEASKNEIKRLIEFLEIDLGVQSDHIHTYFSGNNGFHVAMKNDAYALLDPHARSELVGYLSGTGLISESIGVRRSSSTEDLFTIKFPKSGLSYGWRRRIADKLKIDNSSTNRLKHIVKEKGGYASFIHELTTLVKDMGVRLDPQVTTDIHRVFRMPGTLNGKSGLAKKKCTDLQSFDPFVDACVLGDGKVSVKVKAPLKVKMRNKSFSLTKESADLPAYVAIYLMCKGLAEAI
jgi:DNA primase small subunit